MHTCKGQTDWRYLLFSFKCIFSNHGHAQNAIVPMGNKDSGTQVQNLYPSQPCLLVVESGEPTGNNQVWTGHNQVWTGLVFTTLPHDDGGNQIHTGIL